MAQNPGLQASTSEHNIFIAVPHVSLVNLVGPSILNLKLLAPTEAGLPIVAYATDSSFWLNYSFVKGGLSRSNNHIYAKIENGGIPLGTTLTVVAKPYTGAGQGGFGLPTGVVQLSTIEQRVVQNITSCYTGVGQGNGHQLVYRLGLNTSYESLDFEQSQNVSVLYTISE